MVRESAGSGPTSTDALPDALAPGFNLSALPYLVGCSPYRIRGVGYLGAFVHCKESVPGGVEAVKARLESQELKGFFDQRFSGRTFYDVYPFAIFMRELAAAKGMGVEELLTTLGATRAQHDVHGFLKFMMQLVSTKTLSNHLSVLATQWWGFLTLEQQATDGTRMTVRVKGIPVPLRNFVLPLGVAYHVEALRLSGSPNAHSTFHPDFRVTSGSGLAGLGECTYSVVW
jgi:hypothetical protein